MILFNYIFKIINENNVIGKLFDNNYSLEIASILSKLVFPIPLPIPLPTLTFLVVAPLAGFKFSSCMISSYLTSSTFTR